MQHLASAEGHKDIAELLLESKADVTSRKQLHFFLELFNLLSELLGGFRDRFQGSPLDDAVRHGHVAIQVLSQ